jgi:hypothetical protein
MQQQPIESSDNYLQYRAAYSIPYSVIFELLE